LENHSAVKGNELEITRLLLDAGADPQRLAKTPQGNYPALGLAIQSKSYQMIRLLMTLRVDLVQPEYNALLHALRVDDLGAVFTLMKSIFEAGHGLKNLIVPPSPSATNPSLT